MYAVIMAGGQGTRLWPMSRKNKPKQLQALFSDKTLICETYERLKPKFDDKDIIISTIPDFVDEIKLLLPELPEDNFIVEPALMGNAASNCLVSKILFERDNDSSAIFLPADHVILDKEKFIETVSYAERLINENSDQIITVGIKPAKADINLGYIQTGEKIGSTADLEVYKVQKFTEKPTIEKAEEFIASGQYLWNAGIFIWKTSHMLDLFKQNLPNIYERINIIANVWGNDADLISREYAKVDKTTIDYGIIERTKDILVIPADFGWSDIGTWGTLLEVLSNNDGVKLVSKGNHLSIDDNNCMVLGSDKLIATVGLENIVVVDTPDALLICNSEKSAEVKELIAKLKENSLEQYL